MSTNKIQYCAHVIGKVTHFNKDGKPSGAGVIVRVWGALDENGKPEKLKHAETGEIVSFLVDLKASNTAMAAKEAKGLAKGAKLQLPGDFIAEWTEGDRTYGTEKEPVHRLEGLVFSDIVIIKGSKPMNLTTTPTIRTMVANAQAGIETPTERPTLLQRLAAAFKG